MMQFFPDVELKPVIHIHADKSSGWFLLQVLKDDEALFFNLYNTWRSPI